MNEDLTQRIGGYLGGSSLSPYMTASKHESTSLQELMKIRKEERRELKNLKQGMLEMVLNGNDLAEIQLNRFIEKGGNICNITLINKLCETMLLALKSQHTDVALTPQRISALCQLMIKTIVENCPKSGVVIFSFFNKMIELFLPFGLPDYPQRSRAWKRELVNIRNSAAPPVQRAGPYGGGWPI